MRSGNLRLAWSREPDFEPDRAAAAAESALAAFDSASREQFFGSLDGHFLTVADRRWRVTVFSVYEDGGHRWVQLGLNGPHNYTLTLRMRTGEGVRHAMCILSSWLADPSHTSHVRSVA